MKLHLEARENCFEANLVLKLFVQALTSKIMVWV